MNSVAVAEAAEVLGVSRQRVVQLIHAGRLPAERLGRSWAIPYESLAVLTGARRPHVRPMSARMARAMVDLMGQQYGEPAGPAWAGVSGRDRSRLRDRWAQLRSSPNAAGLLRAWLPARSHAERFSFRGDSAALLADPRVSAGGAAHAGLGLSDGSLLEPHVSDADREGVVWDWLLVPAFYGNLLLRSEPVVRVDLAACLADVADLGGGRNDKAVADVLERARP